MHADILDAFLDPGECQSTRFWVVEDLKGKGERERGRMLKVREGSEQRKQKLLTEENFAL